MLTRPEAADPAVEELKRRARRRLVGAIVLALAAAVILPMLLESDPKPLGDDVSVQIPPIDNGKFITPLSPAKGPDSKAGSPARGAAPPSPKPAAAAPEAVVDGKASSATGKPADAAPTAPADATPAQPIPAEAPASAPEPQAPATPAVKAADSRAEAASPTGAFVVQLAAFADAKAAPALSAKLKSGGFPAYIETVKTKKGDIQRVRVGPYASRETADAQMAKLSAAGYRGVVTTK